MVEPLLVFVNKASGGHKGEAVIAKCQSLLNVSVVVLPDDIEIWERKYIDILTNPNLKIVAAGGDGTINWVASLLGKYYGFKEQNFYRPPLAALPLGSGNDFCRALGWGHSFKVNNLAMNFSQIVSTRNNIISADIWEVQIRRTDTNVMKEHLMLNYFSIGVDAKIAHDFASCRSFCPSLFCCSCINKFHFFCMGFKNLCGGIRPLNSYVTAKVDGIHPAELSADIQFKNSFKTLVFQAIPSIYSGCDLWYSDENRSLDDHLIEIIAAGGSFNLGLAQTGCQSATPLCQGQGATLTTTEPVYYQIDGEGYISNGPTEFIVRRIGSYPVIEFSADPSATA